MNIITISDIPNTVKYCTVMKECRRFGPIIGQELTWSKTGRSYTLIIEFDNESDAASCIYRIKYHIAIPACIICYQFATPQQQIEYYKLKTINQNLDYNNDKEQASKLVTRHTKTPTNSNGWITVKRRASVKRFRRQRCHIQPQKMDKKKADIIVLSPKCVLIA
eukprot:TRINITY_DN9176_c0_g1_i1.p1 TRINITY_DN9176_c0_g1~~TRINITY_DN9176_c0_g1_i1.p1  ORF type:complete len:164 (-),score=15.74 TRINITY_DN9176_c0_g1_i1:26-517(-)